MSPRRTLVVVLQAQQAIGIDLDQAFPPDRFDVVVLTSGLERSVYRYGIALGKARVMRAPRARWARVVADLAGGAGSLEVVSNDEYCLEDCARLRADLGLAARHPDAAAYRDKVVMKSRLRDAGIRVPPFLALDRLPREPRAAARALLGELRLPIVVKPRREANCRGVRVCWTEAQLQVWLGEWKGVGGWQAEAFVEGRHGHVNAIVSDGRVLHVQAGVYTSPLLELAEARPVGGLTLPEPDGLAPAARELNVRVVEALGSDGAFVVHTEFIAAADGQLVVLEAAARAPGAMVSDIASIHAGVQLESASLRLQAGEPVPVPRWTGLCAGWFWFPKARRGLRPAVDRLPLSSDHRFQLIAEPPRSKAADRLFIGATLLAWSRDCARLEAEIRAASSVTVFAPG